MAASKMSTSPIRVGMTRWIKHRSSASPRGGGISRHFRMASQSPPRSNTRSSGNSSDCYASPLKAHRRSRNHMNLKSLAIAAAVAFLSAGTAAQVYAQQPNSNPPAAAAPAAAPAQPGAAGANAAPPPAAATAPADQPAAANPPPAVNPPATGGAASGVGGNSPYGLFALWRGGDFVIRAVIVLLG